MVLFRCAFTALVFICLIACPAVLVECGFLSNAEEEKLLQNEDYQRAVAEAIARGVILYLEGVSAGGQALTEVGP